MLFINNLLLDMELDPRLVEYLSIIIKILLIGLFCIVANFISKKIVIRIITRIVKNSKVKWGNIILERQIFRKLSHIVPAIIIYSFASTFPTYDTHHPEIGDLLYHYCRFSVYSKLTLCS